MSKRLQVLLSDKEMLEIQRIARRQQLTVGEWIRRALREARLQRPVNDTETKLKAVRRGIAYMFPTADISQMIEEVERGYQR